MNRPRYSRKLGLLFIAALAAMPPLRAAEDQPRGPDPAPGLEIFDDASQIRQARRSRESAPAANGGAGDQSVSPASPSPLPDQIGQAVDAGGGAGGGDQAPGTGRGRAREGDRDDFLSDPGLTPRSSQPPYQPPGPRRPAPFSRPPADGDGGEQARDSGYMGAYDDPFADLDGDPAYDPRFAPDQGHDQGYDPNAAPEQPYDPSWNGGGMTAEQYRPDPTAAMLGSINSRNMHFPGLEVAAANSDVQGAGNIILYTLRQRRIVDATMERGVRGSTGAASPYDFQRLTEALNQIPRGPEDPLAAAQRINVILDALEQPMIDDPLFGSVMPQILVRLDSDIQAVHAAMTGYDGDEGALLELSRTYVRAAATCDYFVFPRRQLAGDVSAVMARAETMFFPDGSSRGGDTGGITGNLFQILLMMDHYSRDDGWFRRDLGSMWRTLERPGRFLLEIARPDRTLPLFGPRGSRELLPVELDAMETMLPRRGPGIQRIGLAASVSFPRASNEETYGGIYVERDARDPMGRYLAVRFGPRGDLLDVPVHNDFGALELMSRGGRYLVDAGGYGGAAATAGAHGGLSLDGRHVLEETYTEPGMVSDAVWRTNASIDYALGQAGFADTKTWQRGVLYVKNLPGETRADYWVVLDHVNMRDDPEPRDLAIRHQLAPGVNAYRDGPGVMLSSAMNGTGLRMFAVDEGARIDVTDGAFGNAGAGQVFDAAGGSLPAPSVLISRRLAGDATTSTVLYPADDVNHRPVRIERDSDIIRGRTGALVIDHGMDRIDVIAWAPPGSELVTPTLNLQLSADLAVFRVRRGKIARVDFVNLERFQAKEPDGGMWSMRVNGPAQSLTIEPERGGGWQILADPANRGSASFFDVNLGPAVTRSKFSIRPGEMRVIYR